MGKVLFELGYFRLELFGASFMLLFLGGDCRL